MRPVPPRRATSLFLLLAAGPFLSAAEPVDYLREVKPLLASRCYSCHGAVRQKGKLRLDTAEFIRIGGRSGPAMVAGKHAESLLIERVTGAEGRRMPPESEGAGLRKQE